MTGTNPIQEPPFPKASCVSAVDFNRKLFPRSFDIHSPAWYIQFPVIEKHTFGYGQALNNNMKHHEKFMRLALAEAKKALEAGDFPVGCVLVEDGQVLARGRRTNSGGDDANELDHAEVVTLREFIRHNPLYDLSNVTAYSTMEPCLMCYTTLLLSGIRKFVWGYEDIMGGGTNLSLKNLNQLYAAMQVENISHVLRDESLHLFQDFFHRFSYWADSPLARYTLEQSPEK